VTQAHISFKNILAMPSYLMAAWRTDSELGHLKSQHWN